MLVKKILEQKPRTIITVEATTAIEEAMDLLIKNGIGCLPVLDQDSKLVGIITDKDIFKKIYETKGDYHNLKVSGVMTTELIVGLPDDEISYIASLMDKNWIRHVPILEGEQIVGMVSQRDIIKTQAQDHEIENRYLQMYLSGLGTRDRSAE